MKKLLLVLVCLLIVGIASATDMSKVVNLKTQMETVSIRIHKLQQDYTDQASIGMSVAEKDELSIWENVAVYNFNAGIADLNACVAKDKYCDQIQEKIDTANDALNHFSDELKARKVIDAPDENSQPSRD